MSSHRLPPHVIDYHHFWTYTYPIVSSNSKVADEELGCPVAGNLRPVTPVGLAATAIYSNAHVDGDRPLINVPISIDYKETLLAQFASKDHVVVQGDWLTDSSSRRHDEWLDDEFGEEIIEK
ncbi:hypothetical protein KFK09_018039 [Dendrobium nobile]|uniref:Uncharacterized protein n=1 Tax=Dendrobium nobile TaxID=94219 RepID=A0A8T3AUP5_DENNO|nr:hypothetical protein KFK09_018039 [Dendrobium nobile]